MQTERPRFRQDLVAELIEDGATRFIDVADPDNGQLFRFFEVEYSLACAMDGERDAAGIVRWADEELGLKTNVNEVRTVISTLGSLGYLDDGRAAAAAATEPAAAAVAAQPATEAPRAAQASEPPASKPAPSAKGGRKATPPAGVKKPAPQPEQFDADATAVGSPDLDLGISPGVVAAKAPASAPSGLDVELGNAGSRPAAPAKQDLPRSDELELGAPGGAAAGSASAKKGRTSDVELGAAGTGVSTDLSADMAISTADVKAAVRASQVIKAVDVPPELAAELEDKPAPKAEPAKAEAKPAPKAEPASTKAAVAETKPAPKAEPAKPVAKPVETPTPVVPTAPPSRGINPVLILLLLAVLAGGGYLLWKKVLNKKKDDATAQVQPAQPTPTPAPEAPAPPPVETVKLATEQPAPAEIKPVAAGQIATLIATDSTVKAGDVIANLTGFKGPADKVAALEKQLAGYKADVEKATKARDAAATDAAKKPFETKLLGLNKMIPETETKLAAARTDLEKLQIKAPADGKVAISSKANAKVTPNDVIATLTPNPLLVATFKSAGETTTGANVLLAVKGSDQKLSCTVAATGGDGTKVACPATASTEGTEVTFAGLDPNAAAGSGAASGSGSAPGSAAGSGSSADATPPPGRPTGPDANVDNGMRDVVTPTPATDDKKAPKADKKAPKRPARPAAPAPKSDLFPPKGSGAEPAAPAAPAPAPAPTPAPEAGSATP